MSKGVTRTRTTPTSQARPILTRNRMGQGETSVGRTLNGIRPNFRVFVDLGQVEFIAWSRVRAFGKIIGRSRASGRQPEVILKPNIILTEKSAGAWNGIEESHALSS